MFHITCANGSREETNKWAKFKFALERRVEPKNYQMKIFNKLDVDVLIGMDLINEYGICLDFKHKIIKFGNDQISMINMCDPNQALINKVNLLKITSHEIDDQLSKILTEVEKKNPEIGMVTTEPYEIELNNQDEIINSKPYPIPFALDEAVKEEVKRLLKLGIIRESTSKYSSPAFAIQKKTGGIRLVVNYKRLNKITKTDSYPCNNINNCLHSLRGTQIYSQIDLKNGFFQIPLKLESQKYTSFVLPQGQFEYTRLCFSLKNSPRAFQRAMNQLLGHLSYVKLYLDDILIASKNEKEHIKEVFDILIKSGASINLEKSSFMKP